MLGVQARRSLSRTLLPWSLSVPNDTLGYDEMRMNFIEDIRKLDGDRHPGDPSPNWEQAFKWARLGRVIATLP